MNKLYLGVISMLVIVIVSLSIYFPVKLRICKGIIDNLKEENKNLLFQISSAESMINFQNDKINKYAINKQKEEERHKSEIKKINEKYQVLYKKYKNINSMECSNIIKIIDENQRSFLNE